MSNLTKLEVVAVNITGKNYQLWILDAEIHLEAMRLEDTIKEKTQESMQNRAKTIFFLLLDLRKGLTTKYLTVIDLIHLLNNFKEV